MSRFRIVDAIKTILIISFCAIFSFALDRLGVRAENVMMIFMTGVLVVIVETKKLSYGVASSVLSVALFNFFFTEPRFTFAVTDPNYLVTFLIFIVVSLIASTLASNLQKQALIARENEENTRVLYEITSGGFLITDRDRLIKYSIGKLSLALKRAVTVELRDEASGVSDAGVATFSSDIEETIGEKRFFPLKIRNRSFGVLGVSIDGSPIDGGETLIIETIASQLALALEQEELYRREESSRLEIEREKIRNGLLRSISHDLRTPLTSISGSTAFIVESYDKLDRSTIISLLSDIGSEAVWLHAMVENLLHMTRIQDGKLIVRTSREIVDDLAQETMMRTEKMLGNQEISVRLPDTVLAVDVDATLIIQVLVNLIGNAVKYAGDAAKISVTIDQDKKFARFSVSDDGPGFPVEALARPFELRADSKRGTGMGLYICKAIIQAHGGTIEMHNEENGGACVSFAIPASGTSVQEETP